MEFLNKVEIRGVVGKASTTQFGDKAVTNFNVATEYAYHDAKLGSVIDVTWFNVSAYDDKCAQGLQKGDKVHVVGRLRVSKFTNDAGDVRECYNVLAQTVEPV